MLEPVKRTNFIQDQARVSNKFRNNQNEKSAKKDNESPPLTSVNNQNHQQLSSSSSQKQNVDGFSILQRFQIKGGNIKQNLQHLELVKTHSSQTSKSNNNLSCQNSNKLLQDPFTPNQSKISFGNHRKSVSTLTGTSGSTKGLMQQKLNDFLFYQNSSSQASTAAKLIQSDQQFFSFKNSSYLGNNLNQGNEKRNLAHENQMNSSQKYLCVPKTAESRNRISQTNLTSKVTQAQIEQYLSNTELLDRAEGKSFKFFNSKNNKFDFVGRSQSLVSSQILNQETTLSNKVQIDCLNPYTLTATKNESLFFSSHNFYYFVIPIRSKPSPLKLTVKIKNASEASQNKLKGFISKTANRPNTFNSDDEFDGRSYKLYAEGGKKMFHIDTVFLSLYPEVDMTVQVQVSFGEQKIQMNEAYQKYKKQKMKAIEEANQIQMQQTKEREMKVQESIQNEQQNKEKLLLFHSTNTSPIQSMKNLSLINKSEIMQKDRKFIIQSQEGKKRKNITQFNKFNMPDMFDKYQKMLKQKEEHETKQQEVQERKNQMFQEKCQEVEERFRISCLKSIFQIEKKKIIERNCKYQLWQLVWIKLIKSIIFLKFFAEKLRAKMIKKQIQHRAKFIAIRAIANWMIKLRKIGLYPEKRVLSLSCIVTNKFAQILHQKCEKKAENIISNYLQQSSKITDLKTKGISFVQRVLNIQKQWRETKQKKKRFKELIVRQFSNKYSDLLYEIKLEAKKKQDPYYQPSGLAHLNNARITDYVLVYQIVQNYLSQHWQRYVQLYESYRGSMIILQQMSIENKKNYSISVAMKKPLFFKLPTNNQLKSMVKEYAEAKQLIN
ncbi:hypothetical protein TTHERM_00635800 (macronuclear) [Tetrahymena thermophila SB210]|uniref:Uncharacterized protein n=1 Tax=Tetrahymena thermophila (strain SB210) TaxID=312017 RepID=Q22WX1_TETTS|nr:hypothetical protein TTHERM_00635800 [Tetrahymena thermophila SB210]EAR89875.2 hypothetical protein TTHERM_00635800 [Tetrahymena thermophila SB210]|eukprot:XP_001010120.2 hypothetical protein TTHERM_00635800 [Tetrahymena thermophila SB210]